MDDKFETNNNRLDSIERLHVDVDSNGMLQEAHNNRSIRENNKSEKSKTGRNNSSSQMRHRIIQAALLVLAIVFLVAGLYFFSNRELSIATSENAEEALHSQLKAQFDLQSENTPQETLQLNAVITVRAGSVEDDNSFDPGADYILRPGETLDPNLPAPTQAPLEKIKLSKSKRIASCSSHTFI